MLHAKSTTPSAVGNYAGLSVCRVVLHSRSCAHDLPSCFVGSWANPKTNNTGELSQFQVHFRPSDNLICLNKGLIICWTCGGIRVSGTCVAWRMSPVGEKGTPHEGKPRKFRLHWSKGAALQLTGVPKMLSHLFGTGRSGIQTLDPLMVTGEMSIGQSLHLPAGNILRSCVQHDRHVS
jgi:hypothetical protein